MRRARGNTDRKTWGRRVGIAVAVVAMAFAALLPAAQADGGSSLTFTGEASLPEFPCPVPTETDPPCSGTFAGTISGELGGTHIGNAWTVTLADVPMTADFTYDDPNCINGTANGTATISGGPDHVFGTYDKGGPLPRPISGVEITADFTWERDAVTALVFPINDGTVTVDVAGDGPLTVMTSSVGAGEAVFNPHLDPDDMPDCVAHTNRPPITADVAGTVSVNDPT